MINYSIAIMSTKPGTPKSSIKNTKAYGVAQISEKVDTNGLARHITTHGSVYKKADILAITNLITECVRELLLEGKKVELGALGWLYPTLKTEGANSVDSFGVNNIKEVNVRWTPGKDFKNLRDDASFKLVLGRSDEAQALADEKQKPMLPELS